MARITIEDCTKTVPNRFHLVQMAAIRTKQLKKGARPLVQAEENKEVVMSLREIASHLTGMTLPTRGDKISHVAKKQDRGTWASTVVDRIVTSGVDVCRQIWSTHNCQAIYFLV